MGLRSLRLQSMGRRVRERLRLLEGKEGAEPDAESRVTSGGGRRYRLTRDGARLRAVIPREPRSSIQTHL